MMTITDAARFAIKAHEGQERKYTGRPYIEHPSRVAARTHLAFLDTYGIGFPHTKIEELTIAAWLHDVPEDTKYTFEDLKQHSFKQYSIDIVKELTNPSKGLKLPRAERKRIDREHLAQISTEAKIIKLIDRLDNLSDMFDGADNDFVPLYVGESKQLIEVIMDSIGKSIADIRSSQDHVNGLPIEWLARTTNDLSSQLFGVLARLLKIYG